jgi:ADP-ribose pyrophosphatase YjhB (NUDIX family)
MEFWAGSAGVCVNEKNEVLMVLQGKEHEEKLWAIPAGGMELNETPKQCCIREFSEETGYDVEIVRPLHIKKGESYGVKVEIRYFEVKVLGGEMQIQDPDGLIHEIVGERLGKCIWQSSAFRRTANF